MKGYGHWPMVTDCQINQPFLIMQAGKEKYCRYRRCTNLSNQPWKPHRDAVLWDRVPAVFPYKKAPPVKEGLHKQLVCVMVVIV